MNVNCVIDGALLVKYPPVITDGGLYPFAKNLKSDFFKEEMVKAVRSSINEDLCIVIRFPSLSKTGCAQTRDAIDYLDHLILEIVSKSALFEHYKIAELHLRGELCSLLPSNQIARLIQTLADYFNVQPYCKKVIEVVPARTEEASLARLKTTGFSHIDFLLAPSYDDFLPSQALTDLFKQASHTFDYVCANITHCSELIGHNTKLPQLLEYIVKQSVDQVNITHDLSALPRETSLLQTTSGCRQQLVTTTSMLTKFGYYMLAPGHFVKPDSVFAQAQKNKSLHLNVDGFSLQEYSDVLGIGAGAVSVIANMFSQNVVDVDQYNEMLGSFGDAMEYGCIMSEDELLRRHVVKELLCNLYLDKTLIDQTFDIQFDQYFSSEITKLGCLINDGLVLNTDYCLSITPAARLLIQNVCHIFSP